MIGWSELIFGSMYCGKSEELIRRLKRVRIAGQKYQLFKPTIDNRYAVNSVATHDNFEIKNKVEKILEVHIHGEIKESIISDVMDQISGAMYAQVVKDSQDLLDKVENDTEVVGIDEVQFFDENLIIVIKELIDRGIRVIAAGLDLYASGEPFGIVPTLACQAKYVDKLHAVCVDCGDDAMFSYKVSDTESNKTSKVEVGSVGKYVALCQNCAHIRSQNGQR